MDYGLGPGHVLIYIIYFKSIKQTVLKLSAFIIFNIILQYDQILMEVKTGLSKPIMFMF